MEFNFDDIKTRIVDEVAAVKEKALAEKKGLIIGFGAGVILAGPLSGGVLAVIIGAGIIVASNLVH